MPAKDDDAYKRWKRRIPLLYDWFMQAPLTWPTLACRWGPKLNDHTYKWSQRVYLSEQVSEKGEFNKLCVYAADLCKPRVCAAETCCSWSETSQSPYLKLAKTIFHPGEVNKIRDLETHPEIVLTHTDAPELLLWNVEQQPDRLEEKEGKGKRSRKESVPNLKLTGHEQDAKFAMDTASAAPVVASGGDDGLVLTWNLEDQETAMASAGKTAPTLQAGLRLEGHTATVESVSFRYGSTQQLVSVGDDAQLLLWDARDGLQPTGRVEAAHGADVDIHCVHWSPADPNFIVSGASTGKLKVWDVRKLGGERCALQELEGVNEGETLQVEWSPSQRGVFASGGADQVVSVWDLNRTADDRGYRQQAGVPMELMFQHVGHRSQVVDFQWHADDAWMLMSVSDNSHLESGGGTLNVWRIISLITSSFDEAAAELEQYREYVIHGKRPLFSREQSEPAAASKRPAPAPQDDASRPEACAAEDQPGEAAELRQDAVDGETADGGATYADALPAADPDEDDGPTAVASVPDAEEAGG